MDDQVVQQKVAETPSTSQASGVAAEILGEIRWVDGQTGYCRCPGADRHTVKNGPKDCIVYLSPVPTVYCLHQSCSRAVEEANKALRTGLREKVPGGAWMKLSREEAQRYAKLASHKEVIRTRAAKGREKILKGRWTYEQMQKDSPSKLPADPAKHWREVVSLFPDQGCIWIGDKQHSGKAVFAKHFRPKTQWLEETTVPGPFTSPSLFGAGTFSRSNSNVLKRPFFVVESDELSRDEVGGVFRWLKDDLGLGLRCIIDTAGKSLHGWFDCPDEESMDELKLILPQWGCDPRMFTPSQPCRMAGALRDGQFQRLVYLGKEGV